MKKRIETLKAWIESVNPAVTNEIKLKYEV
jgi:hypothetical protein